MDPGKEEVREFISKTINYIMNSIIFILINFYI